VHEGAVSLTLGLRGIPAEAEELGVARAIALCRLSGAAIHLCPISTARSLRLLREARAEGLPITASTTALHLAWEEEAHLRRPYEPRLLLRPPLRPAADREALREAARDGTQLAVVSQHRPWGRVQMDLEFGQAPWGVGAIESTLGLLLQTFGEDLQTALRLWSTGPASLLGGGAGLVVGAVADLCALEYRAAERRPRRSLAANDPVEGPLPGRVRLLVRGGRVVVGPLPPG
jgi:dihydroorotase